MTDIFASAKPSSCGGIKSKRRDRNMQPFYNPPVEAYRRIGEQPALVLVRLARFSAKWRMIALHLPTAPVFV